jgi:predicted phage terminase large subunit-like protein
MTNQFSERAAAYDAIVREDFYQFLERAFRTLNGDEPFLPNWHIEALVHTLEQSRLGVTTRTIINVPPRSLKSMAASVIFPAFILGHNPSARIICVSYAQDLSATFSRDFRKLVESEWYQRIFPKMRLAKNTKSLIETTQGGKRMATSIDGVVTGFGADFIIIDDLMQPSDAASASAREKVIRYYSKTLFSRLNDKVRGRIIVVMQRMHEEDLTGYLLASGEGKWTHLCLPSVATKDEDFDLGHGRVHHRHIGEVLHPAYEPQAALDELKQELRSIEFEAQYQQNPLPAEGLMVKVDWIQYYDAVPSREGGRVVQSWDTAYKGGSAHDYSVCTTWLELNGLHYLRDVHRERLEFPGLFHAAVRLYKQYQPDRILIEDQGSGITLINMLNHEAGAPVVGRRSKDDKPTRLNSVLGLFEAKKVVFPRNAPWLATLLLELHGFPNAKYDDQVDSISQYLIWARDQSFAADFSFDFFSDSPTSAPEDTVYWVPGRFRKT